MIRPSVDVAGELRRLQAAYRAALPARADELERALASWLESGDVAFGRALHHGAHGLSGAGATYGMYELSALGRELAQQVEVVLQQPAVLRAAEASLRTLVLSLSAAMRAERPSTRPGFSDSNSGHATRDPRRRLLLLKSEDAESGPLESMLSSAGYRVMVEPVNPATAPIPALVEKSSAEIVFVEYALTLAQPEAIQSLSQVTLGVFGGDGSFGPRLHAARMGAKVVLVPPYDDTGLSELESLLGLEVTPPGRVLIVDDESFVAESYAAVLEDAGFLTEIVTDPLLVLETLETFRPNLVLLDLNMPGVSGIEITRVLRQRSDLISTSIVFLSAESSWDLQQQAMSAGADDFLLKPVQLERLVSSVRSRVRRLGRLNRRISLDSLTELMNQGAFKERVQVEVARALREQRPLALALFDLDHFKAVNDAHGHSAGDRVLRSLAQLLRDRLRHTDGIARCGGEEFGVLLPGADEAAAHVLMDQIRRAFQDLTHSSAFGEFRVTLSCGIASVPKAMDPPTLVDWADRALYRAKQNGRNQIAVLPESELRTIAPRVIARPRSLRRISNEAPSVASPADRTKV